MRGIITLQIEVCERSHCHLLKGNWLESRLHCTAIVEMLKSSLMNSVLGRIEYFA